MRLLDLTGKTFGQLEVVGRAPNTKDGKGAWFCRCSCGTVKAVSTQNLKRGVTVSCGCYRRKRSTTHGMSRSSEFHVWCAMRARCTNPKNKDYHHYGARGITVCERWLNSFEAFYADMGPSQGLQLERVDNAKGYGPSNCVWATSAEQHVNRRNTIWLEHSGTTHTLVQWSETLNIPYMTLYTRYKIGKPPEEILAA